MAETYKHSYKSGEILMTSLSVYNTGYQRCEAGYQWGPGVRDHYCIHHILSGTGYYTVGEKTWKLEAGDTFILYPGVEVKYYADQQEPWEYAWVGFMGTLIVDLESRFLPAIVMGMIILISIPMTVSAVTLICLTTNNKKTEV